MVTVRKTLLGAVHSARSSSAGAASLFVVVASLAFVVFGGSFYLYVYNTGLLTLIGVLALNLLMGTAGQVSVGNAGFLAVGGFVTVAALRAGVPFPADVVVAVVVSGAVGVLAGIPAIRLKGLYLALSTLAAFYLILDLATRYQDNTVGSTGFIVPTLFASAGSTSAQRYWAILLTGVSVACLCIVAALTRGMLGRGWRLLRDHPAAAAPLGIPATKYKLLAFAVSSAMIGLQGGLLAHFTGDVTTDNYTLSLAITYLAAVLIGGQDSLAGSIVGAALITSLPYLTPNIVLLVAGSAQSVEYGAQYSEILYGLLIIIFVTLSRDGIVGWVRVADRRLRQRSGLHGGSGRDAGAAAALSTRGTRSE
jgi:branched-chain amino acid transport system permease protein